MNRTRIPGRISRTWAKIRYPLSGFVAWLSTAIGVIGGGVGLVQLFVTNSTVREWVESLGLLAMTGVSLCALALREMTRSKIERLANTLPLQETASEKLRDLRNFLRMHVAIMRKGELVQRTVLAQARRVIEDVLSIYADMYSVLTASPCRTCLKLLAIERTTGNDPMDPNVISLFALARDRYSAEDNRSHDKERESQNIDIISKNSDFLSLWDPAPHKKKYFFSHDLRHDQSYKSTSIDYWRKKTGDPNQMDSVEWPLPYVATIVWPIRQEACEDSGTTSRVLGFVTVDSRVPGAFDEQLHAPLGSILANTLYASLDLYTELSGGMLPTLQEGERNA